MIDMIVFCDRFFVIDWHNFLVIDCSLVIVWLLEFQLCYLPLQWPKEFSESWESIILRFCWAISIKRDLEATFWGAIINLLECTKKIHHHQTLVIGRRAWSRYLNEDWGSGITWEFPGGGGGGELGHAAPLGIALLIHIFYDGWKGPNAFILCKRRHPMHMKQKKKRNVKYFYHLQMFSLIQKYDIRDCFDLHFKSFISTTLVAIKLAKF